MIKVVYDYPYNEWTIGDVRTSTRISSSKFIYLFLRFLRKFNLFETFFLVYFLYQRRYEYEYIVFI